MRVDRFVILWYTCAEKWGNTSAVIVVANAITHRTVPYVRLKGYSPADTVQDFKKDERAYYSNVTVSTENPVKKGQKL